MSGIIAEDKLVFQVSELKQWAYCQRVVYYSRCLPRIRPLTYGMEEGVLMGKSAADAEERRSLRAYGLDAGERWFNLRLENEDIGLRGIADLVIDRRELTPPELIVVDYKNSEKVASHLSLQLAAYALLLEATFKTAVTRGFVYLIPQRKAEAVKLSPAIKRKVASAVAAMREMVELERIPAPTSQIRKCIDCEFRRFCNDVV